MGSRGGQMIEAWYVEIENSFGMCQDIPFVSEDDALKAIPVLEKTFPNDEFTITLYNSEVQLPMTFEEFMSKS
jgi:hypothetical protein